MDRNENAGSAIPGIISTYPNSHVTSMKAWPWPQVLSLMGKEGERAMIDLIVDCGVFIAVENGCGAYHQMSGTFSPSGLSMFANISQVNRWAIFK
jgi:telomerase reverse transcriptase